MAQLERPQTQRQVDQTSKTPPTIHTMEQLLRAGEASNSKSKQSPTYSSSSSSSTNSSGPSSPFFHRFKHHDQEEDHGQNQKKSVLSKVKEKAKKLRHSLSKKKHEDGSLTSPPSAAGLESDGVEEDAEYHGAPMYESEKAPAGYKETTMQQNPRGNQGTPEKHVISTNDKHIVEHDHEKSLNRSLSKRTTQAKTPTAAAAAAAVTILSDPNKTTNKTIAEKLTPVHAEGSSDASNSMTSKFQGLTVSKPTDHHNHYHASSSTVTPTKTNNNSLSFAAPRTPPAKAPSQASSSTNQSSSLAPVTPAPNGKNTSPTAQIWDKGVSMKEYLMNKLEPGEDEKALSQVISEAMSPKRTPGDAGVMEKVREAVTSLLRNEEPAPATRMSSQIPASTNAATPAHASSQIPVFSNAQEVSHHAASRASSQIPVSSNAQEVVQEENHGRILQAN